MYFKSLKKGFVSMMAPIASETKISRYMNISKESSTSKVLMNSITSNIDIMIIDKVKIIMLNQNFL